MTGTPLLETKFYIPQWRSDAVSRPRLIDLMAQGKKLTLVSAPAGCGKTTLLAEWVTASSLPIAWVSLEQGDNDPTVFWTYFLKALQKIKPNLGEGALSLLHSPQPPGIESVLGTLINDISPVKDPFALILDDYHVIEAPAIHGAIYFLLEHLPPPMRLILASRSDPPFPVARLRARGELMELRIADLRFTPEEAAAFLNQMMVLNLSATDVVALENRTEGWIAGLQLAALSMQGRSNMGQFIQAFTGSHHFILDYLVEEVLQQQSGAIRRFLLQTSILQRLSSPLCNAVTQEADGNDQLVALERGNLFVIPLDDQRQWYRYHHLFAEVLQAHLLKEQSEQLPILHLRASQWYEHHDLPSDAIHHALAAKDFERAADLVELNWRAMNRQYQYSTVVGWMQSLPAEQIRLRPVLSAGYAWALMCVGDLEAAQTHIEAIEQWVSHSPDTDNSQDSLPTDRVVVNEAEFQLLPATLASAHAYQAQTLGNMPSAIHHAQQALALLPQDAFAERAVPTSMLGLAHWSNGNLDAAHGAFSELVISFKRSGLF